MTFKTFLIKNYFDSDTPEGDLARDAYRDKNFPQTKDYWRIKDHLEIMHACDGALEAFESAYDEFLRETHENISFMDIRRTITILKHIKASNEFEESDLLDDNHDLIEKTIDMLLSEYC